MYRRLYYNSGIFGRLSCNFYEEGLANLRICCSGGSIRQPKRRKFASFRADNAPDPSSIVFIYYLILDIVVFRRSTHILVFFLEFFLGGRATFERDSPS